MTGYSGLSGDSGQPTDDPGPERRTARADQPEAPPTWADDPLTGPLPGVGTWPEGRGSLTRPTEELP
ncbi:MAG TPA: hypothetical protein VNV66_17265, partial [Pilimelia sp.]|nr:hypothetical protein [Pilimelia sp.]